MANPMPRAVCMMLIRQRTPCSVRERSAERRSRKFCQWVSPMISRAQSSNTLAGIGSFNVRSAPRTRSAGGKPGSKCRSLARCCLAVAIKSSKFMCRFYWPSVKTLRMAKFGRVSSACTLLKSRQLFPGRIANLLGRGAAFTPLQLKHGTTVRKTLAFFASSRRGVQPMLLPTVVHGSRKSISSILSLVESVRFATIPARSGRSGLGQNIPGRRIQGVEFMVSERLQHQRYELKYHVAEAKTLRIRDFVQGHLDIDEYSALQTGLSYPALSLYLDSDSLDTHWHTINGNRNRFKLRLRYYDDQPDTPVFFETKRRENNVILKERGGVRKSAVRWLLAGHMPERKHMLNPNDHEALVAVQRFCHRMLQLNARPKMHVAYLREAYENPRDNNVRVTLDRQVASQPNPEP